MFKIVIIFIIIILVLILIIRYLWLKNYVLQKNIKEIISKKQSLSSKYGKMTEQFLPFLDLYPYNEQNFRFLGSPIDGVQFEDDKIIFIEFKTSNSKMSIKQKEIKNLVDNKKVYFQEYNLK
jgi:predicted Holliday junction resolvase-like endonuclease